MPADKRNADLAASRRGMQPMEWIAELPPAKVNSYDISSGVTFSTEAKECDQTIENLELEVLKAVLNREAYLVRLKSISRTVSRKFKPEIADIIDLIRAATLDVLENIVRWRAAKVGDQTYSVEYTCYHSNLIKFSAYLYSSYIIQS